MCKRSHIKDYWAVWKTHLCCKITAGAVHLWNIDPLTSTGTIAFSCIHTGYTVESTQSIDAVIISNHPYSTPPTVHVSDKCPLTSIWTIVLGRVHTFLAIESPAYVHLSWSISDTNYRQHRGALITLKDNTIKHKLYVLIISCLY